MHMSDNLMNTPPVPSVATMRTPVSSLYPGVSGALAIQDIRQLMQDGHILEARESHLQPASLDLSISGEVYRMRGSFLPRQGEKIRDILKDAVLFPSSLEQPLELNGIYWIRLNESLRLPEYLYAFTNNKSSSGRVNLQTRLILNGVSSFDHVPRGYEGELWLEVVPKSFPVKLRHGERLNQLRLFGSDAQLTSDEYRQAHQTYGLLRDLQGNTIDLPEKHEIQGVTLTIDLTQHEIIGYKCTPTTARVLDYSKRDHDPAEFFEPMYRPRNEQIILKRDEFYILATKEAVRVPNEFAGQMSEYDVSKGEFRAHYAGFFDPGFGYGPNGELTGQQGVLEVFTHDNDFVLRDGQPICSIVYERLSHVTDTPYGSGELGSNYFQQTGPRLSKHFRQV